MKNPITIPSRVEGPKKKKMLRISYTRIDQDKG